MRWRLLSMYCKCWLHLVSVDQQSMKCKRCIGQCHWQKLAFKFLISLFNLFVYLFVCLLNTTAGNQCIIAFTFSFKLAGVLYLVSHAVMPISFKSMKYYFDDKQSYHDERLIIKYGEGTKSKFIEEWGEHKVTNGR